MTRTRFALAAVIATALTFSAVSIWVYRSAFDAALTAAAAAGEVRLSEAAGRLAGQLQVYRALVNFVAEEPAVRRFLERGGHAQAVSEQLSSQSLKYGALRMDLTDAKGGVVVSSDLEAIGSRVPEALIKAAFEGRLGYEQRVFGASRTLLFSRGLLSDGPRNVGAVVLSVDLAALEFDWAIAPEPIVFFDDSLRVLLSNRPSLLLRFITDVPQEYAFPLRAREPAVVGEIWTFEPSDALPKEALVLKRRLPLLDLTAHIFLDTRGPRAAAWQQTLLALALLSVVTLIAAVAYLQRRRLRFEEDLNASLEARVEAQTAELRAAQGELVEASKLAALGRLSAGLSHELNQPLAAILNFSENGQTLVDRGRAEAAKGNLVLISEQVRRIMRIISGLRTFARDEAVQMDRIDLAEVLRSSIVLCEEDLRGSGVTLETDLPDAPVMVMGGRVRLEQVMLNLIANAQDAMQSSAERVLRICLSKTNDMAQIDVRDTGPGVADPSRVFEPFYTTKELGASKGLGMGLALSHGIVRRFGGQFFCRNEERGACFTITLPLSGAKTHREGE